MNNRFPFCPPLVRNKGENKTRCKVTVRLLILMMPLLTVAAGN